MATHRHNWTPISRAKPTDALFVYASTNSCADMSKSGRILVLKQDENAPSGVDLFALTTISYSEGTLLGLFVRDKNGADSYLNGISTGDQSASIRFPMFSDFYWRVR